MAGNKHRASAAKHTLNREPWWGSPATPGPVGRNDAADPDYGFFFSQSLRGAVDSQDNMCRVPDWNSPVSLLPWTPPLAKPVPPPEDAIPVIEYIVDEMNRNSVCAETKKMQQLNSFSVLKCIGEWQAQSFWHRFLTPSMPQMCEEKQLSSVEVATIIWTVQVRQNGPWDHKPKIRGRFHPRRRNGEQVWHRLGARDIYYDTWSNIHFGYVGRAAGFSESTLLDGAGLEQIGSDIVRKKMPEKRPGVSGLRAYDDTPDQAAIDLGIRLYRHNSQSVTAQQVITAVNACPDLSWGTTW